MQGRGDRVRVQVRLSRSFSLRTTNSHAPAPDSASPRLRSAIATTAGTNILAVLLGSVGGIILARTLGPAARGDLVVVFQWSAVLSTLACLGITHSTCYWVSRRRADAGAILSTATAGGLASGAALALLGLIIGPYIGRTASVDRALQAMLLLSPIFIVTGIWTSTLQAVHVRRWNIARSIQPICYFGFISALALFGSLTFTTAVVSIGLGVCSSLFAVAMLRGTGLGALERPRWDLARPLYSYGARVLLSNMPLIVNVSLDQLVLSVMPGVSASRLASYAVAVSLTSLALPLSAAFGAVAFPRIAATRSERERRRVERITIFGAASTASLVIGLVAVSGSWAVPTLFGPGYGAAVGALWRLAPGTTFLALNRVMGDLLRGRGHPSAVTFNEAIGAACTVVLLLILTPRYGINGAAIASSIAYATVFVMMCTTIHRIRRKGTIDEVKEALDVG